MSTGDDSSARCRSDWDAVTVDSSPAFTERLWPGPLGWSSVLAAAGVMAIAMSPVRPWLAVVGGVGTLVIGFVAAVALSPLVTVGDGVLTAGRARIPVRFLGEGRVLDRDGVRIALGPGSDARDYVVLRSWLPGAVSVAVSDPADPTPRWLVSSRRPAELLAALEAARAQAAHSEQIG